MNKNRDSSTSGRWREIIRDQARSGLPVAAYCRRAGVPLSSFYFWRRKLRNGAATFAEVRVTPQPGRLTTGLRLGSVERLNDEGSIELRLPGERCLVVRPGFDRQMLRDLLVLLEASISEGHVLEDTP